MSALDRVERNNRDEIMVPVNVEGLVDNEGLSTKQAIVLGGLGLILGIDILWFKDRPAASSLLNWVLNIGVWALIAQFCIRKWVIDEKYKMQQIAEMDKFQHIQPVLMWDVMAVNDDTNIIQFSDGRVGLLVGLEQATIVGREPDFQHTHYNAISDFLKILNKNKVKYIHMNLMINAKNDNRLAVLGDTVNSCAIPSIQRMTRMHLGYLRGIEARTLYERQYYLCVGSATLGGNNLQNIVDEAIAAISAAAYNKVFICNEEEIGQIMAETSCVDFFDAEETMRQMAKTKNVLKPVLNIETIELNNTLSDDELHPGVANSTFVKRTDVDTEITVNEQVKMKLREYTKMLEKDSAIIPIGTFEKYLLGKKNSNNANVAKNNANNRNSKQGKVDSGLSTDISDVFGDSNITNIKEYAAEQETEAREVYKALGKEDEWKRQNELAEKQRKAEEAKEMLREENRRREADIAARNAKMKEAEEKAKADAARKVNADDF